MTERPFCAGCFRINEEKEADLFCQTCDEPVCQHCAEVHKKLRPVHIVILQNGKELSVKQKIIKQHQKPPLKTTDKDQIQTTEIVLQAKCSLHEDQILNLFCSEHNQFVCSFCAGETHQNCSAVAHVEQAARDFENKGFSVVLTGRLLNIIHTMERIMGELDNDLSQLNEQRQEIRHKIVTIKKDIATHLDDIEADLENEMSNTYEEFENKTKTTVTDIRNRYENLIGFRYKLQSQQRNMKVNGEGFRILKSIQVEIQKHEQHIQEIQSSRIIRNFEFHPHDNVSGLVEDILSFGTLSVVDNTTFAPSGGIKLSLVKSFKTSRIKDKLRVFRSCFIPENKLLFCAFNECCLFSCKTDGSNSKEIPLEFQPISVALYNKEQAIVTLGPHGIQVINLSTPTLTRGLHIEMDCDCGAVCTKNGKIWIRSGVRTLSQIDIRGNILKNINTIFDPRDIFMNINGDMFCSSNYGDKVYIVTVDGEQREFYESPNLKLPKGIAVDNNGNVYICGYITYNIHRITPGGEGDVVLSRENGIKQPRGFTFNKDTNELMFILDDGETVEIYNPH